MRLLYLVFIVNIVTREHKKKLRSIKVKHKTLIDTLINVIKTLNLVHFQESLTFYFAAIAFPGDLRKMIKSASVEKRKYKREFCIGLQILNTIEAAFLRHSKSILNEFIKIPEASYLLINYLETLQEEEFSEVHSYLKEIASKTLYPSNKERKSSRNINLTYQNQASKILNLIFE